MSTDRARRPGRAWLATALLAAVAIAVAALALRPSSSSTTGVRPGTGPPLTVHRVVTPSTVLFGDRVEAVIEVTSVDERVAPGSVRVDADFRPYAKAAERTVRSGDDGVTLHRVTISLDCLSEDCLAPRSGARTFRFPPAVVAYRLDGRPRTLGVPWDDLRLTSRITPGRTGLGEEAPRLGDDLAVPPGPARAVLAVLAAVLAALGAWLLLGRLWPWLSLARRRRRRLSPLDRALEQLDAAARIDDEATRRRVLDHLATRLGEVDAAGLEQQSRRLAWERTPPAAEELVALGEQVRTGLEAAHR